MVLVLLWLSWFWIRVFWILKERPDCKSICGAVQIFQKRKIGNYDYAEMRDIRFLLPPLDWYRKEGTAWKKGIECLGGKNSNAYNDKCLRQKLYSDLHRQKRKTGISPGFSSPSFPLLPAIFQIIPHVCRFWTTLNIPPCNGKSITNLGLCGTL